MGVYILSKSRCTCVKRWEMKAQRSSLVFGLQQKGYRYHLKWWGTFVPISEIFYFVSSLEIMLVRNLAKWHKASEALNSLRKRYSSASFYHLLTSIS